MNREIDDIHLAVVCFDGVERKRQFGFLPRVGETIFLDDKSVDGMRYQLKVERIFYIEDGSGDFMIPYVACLNLGDS